MGNATGNRVTLGSLMLLATLAMGCGQGESPPATAGASLPAVGSPAPRFKLNDHEGHTLAFGGPSPGWKILTFYREASSPW